MRLGAPPAWAITQHYHAMENNNILFMMSVNKYWESFIFFVIHCKCRLENTHRYHLQKEMLRMPKYTFF